MNVYNWDNMDEAQKKVEFDKIKKAEKDRFNGKNQHPIQKLYRTIRGYTTRKPKKLKTE